MPSHDAQPLFDGLPGDDPCRVAPLVFGRVPAPVGRCADRLQLVVGELPEALLRRVNQRVGDDGAPVRTVADRQYRTARTSRTAGREREDVATSNGFIGISVRRRL
jgi:hypothetical protein